MTRLITLLVGSIWISSASAAEISVQEMRPGTYEFVLTSPTVLSESESMVLIANAAVSTCRGVPAVPGRWSYKAEEAIGGGDSSSRETFRFVQEVSCVPGAQMQPSERRPTLQSEEESRGVQDIVKRKSEAYFQLIASKRTDEALKQVAIERMGMNEARWKNDKLWFQAMAGEPIEISITKVTIYDNPPEAPQPGLYVAADYSNVYRNVPIHCGYLIWFRPAGGEFRITREETGHATSEQLKSIESAQLPEVRRKLRCLAP